MHTGLPRSGMEGIPLRGRGALLLAGPGASQHVPAAQRGGDTALAGMDAGGQPDVRQALQRPGRGGIRSGLAATPFRSRCEGNG